MTIVVKAKTGMEDVYTFLQQKKANLDEEVRKEVAEREKVINDAIATVTYTEEVEDEEVNNEYENNQ